MIEISHVDKYYGASFQALKDCTTRVARGEVVVVDESNSRFGVSLTEIVNLPRDARAA